MKAIIKKKIKDLTLEEYINICEKNETDEKCRKHCPLKDFCKMYITLAIDTTKLESEVEVDE